MEHVPRPQSVNKSHGPNIKVPCLVEEDYDGGPILSYPERRGWDVRFSNQGAHFLLGGREPPATEVAGFVQTWLYFGLLRVTIGPSCVNASFVTTDEAGHAWLTTSQLQDIIGPWS